MARELPAGTVTFLFTDAEGSTRLLHQLGEEAYAEELAEHRRIVRGACAEHGGVEVDTQGDAFFVAFATAQEALAAARQIAEGLRAGPIRARIGLHTGVPRLGEEGYVGEDVHLAARIAAAAHGGQVVVSPSTAALVDRAGLKSLGEHRLKDIGEPVAIFQLGEASFPPLRTISNTNLPRPVSSFVGRERELREVLDRIASTRLLTLTGPGGAGKTRLALEAAATLVSVYQAGVFWVGLASLRESDLVSEAIAQELGAKNGLAGHIGERQLLLLLDNLEQVIDAAPGLSNLLSACPNLTLLVTSRALLRVEGETEYSVPPLAQPEAVTLFCERSRLEAEDVIAELCARLDNLPLAVELAAARTRALTPAQILERLSGRLDLLSGGRDADPRQQTLRATIEWSYELLSDDERTLFRRLSVFAGGCTLEAAEEVTGADVDTLQSLVENSLARFSGGRYRMLETIREYAAERLGDEAEAMRRRHRAWIVELAQESAPQLHTGDETAVSARLAPEYENIRAAVASALEVGESDDVARLLGSIWPFLISRGRLAEACDWTEATLEAREQLSNQVLADALTGGSEVMRFAGRLDRAIELKEELASIGGDPQRPNWRAATLADLAEIALAQGDLESARRYAEESDAAGGGARVELDLGEIELRAGKLDAARTHAEEALAGFEEGGFNYACALELLGEILRRSDEAVLGREWFSRGLRAFAGLSDAGGVADCLEGLGRLATDPERAGRLVGAAEELRRTSVRLPARADVPLPDVPAAARSVGATMSLDDAVAFALGKT
jgi:predicted ATPase/class 3 adenylate cyclase